MARKGRAGPGKAGRGEAGQGKAIKLAVGSGPDRFKSETASPRKGKRSLAWPGLAGRGWAGRGVDLQGKDFLNRGISWHQQ